MTAILLAATVAAGLVLGGAIMGALAGTINAAQAAVRPKGEDDGR